MMTLTAKPGARKSVERATMKGEIELILYFNFLSFPPALVSCGNSPFSSTMATTSRTDLGTVSNLDDGEALYVAHEHALLRGRTPPPACANPLPGNVGTGAGAGVGSGGTAGAVRIEADMGMVEKQV